MSRRLVAIAAGACAVLLAVWFLLFWGPQGGKLDDAEKRQATADAANGELELRLARLQASQERAPELMANVEELRRAVPDDPELAQFILDANQVASDAGVDFISIAPSPPAAAPVGPPVVNLSINVTGTYFSVLDYLAGLADLPRIVVVDDLTLTPGNDAAGGQQLTVAVTARMFTTTVPSFDPTAAASTTAAATDPNASTTTTTVGTNG